ncbi:MAG: restriction endonuclease [Actinomycetota bacterium]
MPSYSEVQIEIALRLVDSSSVSDVAGELSIAATDILRWRRDRRPSQVSRDLISELDESSAQLLYPEMRQLLGRRACERALARLAPIGSEPVWAAFATEAKELLQQTPADVNIIAEATMAPPDDGSTAPEFSGDRAALAEYAAALEGRLGDALVALRRWAEPADHDDHTLNAEVFAASRSAEASPGSVSDLLHRIGNVDYHAPDDLVFERTAMRYLARAVLEACSMLGDSSRVVVGVCRNALDAALLLQPETARELARAQHADLRHLLVARFKELDASPAQLPAIERHRVHAHDRLPTDGLVIPSSHLRILPDHALLSVSLRAVARVVGSAQGDSWGEVNRLIDQLELACDNGWGDSLLGIGDRLVVLAGELAQDRRIPGWAESAVFALGRCTRCVWADEYEQAEHFARVATVYSDRAARERGVFVTSDILQDIVAAGIQTRRLTANPSLLYSRRRRREPFPQHLFAEFLRFIPGDGEATVGDVRPAIPELTAELIAKLNESPSRLPALDWREFEAAIAGVFELYGFEVELTRPSRDGGKDVIAVAHRPTHVRYLIECKRYAPSNRVGIDVVQRLYGVMKAEKGTRAIAATTSTFTAPAMEWIEDSDARLEFEARDFDGVRSWLALADRVRLRRTMLG